MLDSNDLLAAIKRAATEAAEASQPADFCFGKVISTNPLKISVEQKMVLSSAQLVLTRNVTEYKVDMTVNHTTDTVDLQHNHSFNGNADVYSGNTDTGGTNEPHKHSYSHTHSFSGNTENSSANLNHSHKYSGRKIFVVHNGLSVGESVVLIKQKGGQKYLVLDRVVDI